MIADTDRGGLLAAAGLAVTLGVLFTRTWGLHFDEIGYFRMLVLHVLPLLVWSAMVQAK